MKDVELLSKLTVRVSPVPLRYLKWHDAVIATIEKDGSVEFIDSNYNTAVQLTTGGKSHWAPSEFRDFLSERLPSRSRRDIEKILRRCSLSEYDEIGLANVTRAINARDLLWLSNDQTETFEDIIEDVFGNIFIKRLDIKGDSLISPEGINEKRYGVSRGSYGIYKRRLHPYSSDIESEVAVYELAKRIGVECCETWLAHSNHDIEVFSKFEYDFSQEFIVHVRRLFSGVPLGDNEYDNLISVLPQFKEYIQKMILLDFITRQTDRHMSNVALKVSQNRIEFYKLYDNGRSLFYEDREELIAKAIKDIPLYSTEFGLTGTYFDYVSDISKETNISNLINLTLSKDEISRVLRESQLKGERLEGSIEWVYGCLQLLKEL